jgi:hypothetical protein
MTYRDDKMDGCGPVIPKDWVNLVRVKTTGSAKSTKRKCIIPADTRNVCQKTDSANMPATSMRDACNNILSAICRASGNCIDDIVLNLDPILSNVAYKDLVENLFGSDSKSVAPTIPLITKAYEESFMREPMHSHERVCVMDSQCECNFISKDKGFVGVEFLLPNETDTGGRQTCILCHRRTVQTLFYDLLYSGRPFKGVIQRFGNICSKVGEYSNDVMLICPIGGPVQCMPFPSVSHQRNRYSVVVQGGVRYAKQLNMDYVEDFRNPFPTGY